MLQVVQSAARKSVFADLLKWDVPVLDDRYEVDPFFDDIHATYLILAEPDGTHLGSSTNEPSRPGAWRTRASQNWRAPRLALEHRTVSRRQCVR